MNAEIDAKEILVKGLEFLSGRIIFSDLRHFFSSQSTRFAACFGADPSVLAKVWSDLYPVDTQRNINMFFLCLYWLKNYPTESVMAVKFNMDEKRIRVWLWYYVECLSELGGELIKLPHHFPDNIHFPLAVDGTHCMIYEPMHQLYPMDKDFFSHKRKTAAYAYQIAISTTESKILSIDGPYPAGKYSDKVMFRESGLQDRLVSQNKWAIADGGYEGLEGAAVPNRKYQNRTTNIYFRRNRARIERLMGYFKNFGILSGTFRIKKHRKVRHEMVFRAVGCIVQTQLQTCNPIFDP